MSYSHSIFKSPGPGEVHILRTRWASRSIAIHDATLTVPSLKHPRVFPFNVNWHLIPFDISLFDVPVYAVQCQ